MIALDSVSILTPGLFKRDPILVNATTTFERGERVGVLAAPGSGKSTLARLLAGIELPDTGTIQCEGRVSWPIGFAGFLHPALSVQDNLTTFARLVGLDPGYVTDFCAEFVGIGGLPRKMAPELTPTQRAILAYACAVSIPGPAMWIADEVITVGEPVHRKKCDDVLADRLKAGGLIFISRNVRQLRLYCDRFYVLINKRLLPCDDLDVGQEALDLFKQQHNELM
ncbi:ATP-binding cassette domain-containing protein [Mameliella alba]|nr:ATP-binding cassette domain-containing protein [Mameliella alba]MBY6172659.1 ATP-binding cassette domain-containing protein [Mameliella alba]MBY6177641.1 ATP-binding cassette domain-containing protein [Mameliella alba]